MARRPLLGVAVGVAVAAVGCGPTELATTPRQARALARSINLSALDLPGYTPWRHVSPPGIKRQLAHEFRCLGAVPRRLALADVNSDDFHAPPSSSSSVRLVTAEVVVMPSAKLAKGDTAAISGQRVRQCTVTYGAHGRIGHPRSSTQLRAPAPGAVAWRIEDPVKAPGQPQQLAILDSIFFQRGQVEVQLVTLSYRVPFPSAEQHRLLRLLQTRTRDHVK